MLNKAFSKYDVFNQSLNASWLKKQAIANNIANVNTPGYKREVVNFDQVLKDYLDGSKLDMTKTNEKHMDLHGDLRPGISKETGTSYRKDENNVNLDTEMAEEAANLIRYQALVQQLSSDMQRMKSAIRGGR